MSSQVLFDAPGPKARVRHRIIAVLGILALLAVLYWVYGRMDQRNQWEADRWTPFLRWTTWDTYVLPGLFETLRAAALAIVISMVLALGLAMGRMSDIAPLRWAVGVFVEFFRAVPVLIMMIFTAFFLSRNDFTPTELNPLIATVTGLVLYNSAVLCEVIRNGVSSLPSGQREAGLSIGLTPSQTRRTILVPQALTAMLPTLVSQIIVITKDSALGYIILYPELLTMAGRQLGSKNGNILQAYIFVAVMFIVINYGISKIAEAVEARQRRKGRTAGPVGSSEVLDQPSTAGGPDLKANTQLGGGGG
ncbi:amino acid ABC transporter permease [Ornithinicoccus hortensis]|uniref:Amino acid ABC transporter membrane protein 2 (PAAT family) n=1 Tax=Ornithinicoccus hortensis TaxID=82346 RepID=A0A542YS57_9MICO|nr:amino acid ABC transporter permease [Ornithinicoccus hortensis]TQL50929.1 amino acid ABC transporter membrane protein 2 (PAAT family) [Ornithinicoccus hortensis]